MMSQDPAEYASDPAPLSRRVREMFDGYRAAALTTAELAAAELQLAGSTVMLLLILGLSIGLLASTAWIIAMLAFAALFAGAFDWALALAGVAIANLIAAAGGIVWARTVTPNLGFRELRALLDDWSERESE